MEKRFFGTKNIIATVLLVVLVVALLVIRFPKTIDGLQINFTCPELRSNTQVQMFYDTGKGISESTKLVPVEINETMARFDLGRPFAVVDSIRLDPIDYEADMTINSISFTKGDELVDTITADKILRFFTPERDISRLEKVNDTVLVAVSGEDPVLNSNKAFRHYYMTEISMFGITNIILILMVGVIYIAVVFGNRIMAHFLRKV